MKILLSLCLLLPLAAHAADESPYQMMIKKTYVKQEFATISKQKAFAECKFEVEKQYERMDAPQDIGTSLSQMSLFSSCMGSKGWKFQKANAN